MNRKSIQGYTTMIKVDGSEYRGDGQVLSGFFSHHNGNSTPPPDTTKSDANTTYFYATINVEEISYFIQKRKWKLPQLSFNQMQAIIDRLKYNKSPDYFGFSAQHVKHVGCVSTHYLMKYINISFQSIEHSVPLEELVGSASLVHKGSRKSHCDPKNFRILTVCALLRLSPTNT